MEARAALDQADALIREVPPKMRWADGPDISPDIEEVNSALLYTIATALVSISESLELMLDERAHS